MIISNVIDVTVGFSNIFCAEIDDITVDNVEPDKDSKFVRMILFTTSIVICIVGIAYLSIDYLISKDNSVKLNGFLFNISIFVVSLLILIMCFTIDRSSITYRDMIQIILYILLALVVLSWLILCLLKHFNILS